MSQLLAVMADSLNQGTDENSKHSLSYMPHSTYSMIDIQVFLSISAMTFIFVAMYTLLKYLYYSRDPCS